MGMPRARLVFFGGAVYHENNRLAHGERVCAADDMAARFVELLPNVMGGDGVTVFPWVALTFPCRLAVWA